MSKTNCSSCVKYTLGLKNFDNIITHTSHKLRMASKFSFCHFQNAFLDHQISKIFVYERIFKFIVALKIALFFSESHKISVCSLQDFNTQASKRKPVKTQNSILLVSFLTFPNALYPCIFEFMKTIYSISFVTNNLKADSSSRILQEVYLVSPGVRFKIFLKTRLQACKKSQFYTELVYFWTQK